MCMCDGKQASDRACSAIPFPNLAKPCYAGPCHETLTSAIGKCYRLKSKEFQI